MLYKTSKATMDPAGDVLSFMALASARKLSYSVARNDVQI
jgi:hypothetical protein